MIFAMCCPLCHINSPAKNEQNLPCGSRDNHLATAVATKIRLRLDLEEYWPGADVHDVTFFAQLSGAKFESFEVHDILWSGPHHVTWRKRRGKQGKVSCTLILLLPSDSYFWNQCTHRNGSPIKICRNLSWKQLEYFCDDLVSCRILKIVRKEKEKKNPVEPSKLFFYFQFISSPSPGN